MIPLHHILFLDIETVPAYADFDGLPEDWKGLWEKKAEQLLRNRADDTADSIYERAGIYAEFGRIICISCGIFTGPVADRKLEGSANKIISDPRNTFEPSSEAVTSDVLTFAKLR